MSPRQAGFTLLEVLVSLVILGLLLAGLAQGTQFGLRVADRQAAAIAATADLDSTDRVLRGLIAQMDPGTLTAAPLLDATANGLAFTTNLDSVAPAAGIGMADIGIGVSRDHRLVLRWAPHSHAIRLGPAPAATETTLLPGVARADFAYCCGPDGGFVSQWASHDLPSLVRITLTPQPGQARGWPPIVAAPVRTRLNG